MGRRGKRRKFEAPKGAENFRRTGFARPRVIIKWVPIRARPVGRKREAAKVLEFELASARGDQIIELRGK